MEEWKIIPSDPTLMASTQGRIMVIPWKHPTNGKTYGGTPTRGQWDGKRFVYIRKHHKTRKVARLVCETFNGPPPEGKNHCMHLDENSMNNQPQNLKWGTNKENLNFPGYLEYCRSRTGDNSSVRKGMR